MAYHKRRFWPDGMQTASRFRKDPHFWQLLDDNLKERERFHLSQFALDTLRSQGGPKAFQRSEFQWNPTRSAEDNHFNVLIFTS